MEHLAGVSRNTPVRSPFASALSSRSRNFSVGRDDAPLACLAVSPLGARYHAWHGASGARHTTSVFPVERAATDAGLPAYDGFVLVTVTRRDGALHFLDAVAIETEADRARAVARGLARTAGEWHVHLLASDAHRRRAVVGDILDRHRPAMALSA